MPEPLLVEKSARGIATLTLNRPEAANCYDEHMMAGLVGALETLGPDESVRAIVLRGAGRHFSGGADVGWHGRRAKDPKNVPDPGMIWEVCGKLRAAPPPTIALVHGACIGGSLGLAASCDILIAASDAVFAMPEVRLGFAPGPGSAPVFARAVGLRHFRRYAMTGQRFGAGDALRIGLAHELSDPEVLDEALGVQIEEILLAAPNAARRTKLMASRLEPPVPSLKDIEHLFAGSLGSPEAEEGRKAFQEKRKPAWYPK
jgi:methylglutaconyl-CoA hydratase